MLAIELHDTNHNEVCARCAKCESNHQSFSKNKKVLFPGSKKIVLYLCLWDMSIQLIHIHSNMVISFP